MARNVIMHLNGVDYDLPWTVEHESDSQITSLRQQLVAGDSQFVDVVRDGSTVTLRVSPDRLWAFAISLRPEVPVPAMPRLADGHGGNPARGRGF